jgi:hypothetical protein
MASYFTRAPQQPYCPSSGVDHREVTTSCCPGCGLRNPTFRARSPIPPDAEVIPISDDSPNLPAKAPAKAPPRPSRGATHLAKVPWLILGHADLERQQAIKREADRKPKTGIQAPSTSTIHFSVGLARWKWDDSAAGSWSTCQNDKEWSIDLPNVEMSSLAFLSEIRAVLVRLSQRTDVKGWILPEGEGDWTLSHSNPRKGAAQEIADWEESPLLSDVIDQGAYSVKSRGNKNVVMLWLCWTPERLLQRSPTPTPVKNTPVKKGNNVKKEINKEIKQEVKQENKPEPPYNPTPAGKSPRAISAEMYIRTRNRRK